MEVHHHPRVEKKNLKEYLLEGLMIFVAVTMGFFAESLREYFGDREKEAQYMHSLAEDLKKDTAALHYSIGRLQANLDLERRLVVLFAKNQLNEQDDTLILQISFGAGISVDIVFNDRTSSQLKSSGSIRLIKNKNIADSILEYWNNQFVTYQIHERFETMRMEQRKIGYKTFSWYKRLFMGTSMGQDSSLITEMPGKAIIDPQYLTEFMNVSGNLFGSGNSLYMPTLKRQLELATTIIELIQKHYSSENK
jgi:hypothetical protein